MPDRSMRQFYASLGAFRRYPCKQHHNGDFGGPPCCRQRFYGFLFTDPGRIPDHPLNSGRQLGIACFDIHHQILVGLAQFYHGGGRKHI